MIPSRPTRPSRILTTSRPELATCPTRMCAILRELRLRQAYAAIPQLTFRESTITLENPDNLEIPDTFETLEIGTLQFEIFNEAELAGSKNVENLSQGVTALIITANNVSTIPAITVKTEKESTHFTKDIKNGFIAGRTRRAIYKAELPKRYFKKKWE